MPYNLSPDVLKSVLVFLECTEDAQALYRGLHIIAWDYMEKNIDTGVHEEINGQFLADFNSLLELVWLIHILDKRG